MGEWKKRGGGFVFQEEDGIRGSGASRGIGDGDKRQKMGSSLVRRRGLASVLSGLVTAIISSNSVLSRQEIDSSCLLSKLTAETVLHGQSR